MDAVFYRTSLDTTTTNIFKLVCRQLQLNIQKPFVRAQTQSLWGSKRSPDCRFVVVYLVLIIGPLFQYFVVCLGWFCEAQNTAQIWVLCVLYVHSCVFVSNDIGININVCSVCFGTKLTEYGHLLIILALILKSKHGDHILVEDKKK